MPAVDLATNREEALRAAQLGFATELLLSGPRKSFRLASLTAWLLPPIRLNQIRFSFDAKSGRPRAYVTWAYLSDAVSIEMLHNPSRLLHICEWNEGANLWLIDVVGPWGGAPSLLRQLRDSWADRFDCVRGIRRDDQGGIARVIEVRLQRGRERSCE